VSYIFYYHHLHLALTGTTVILSVVAIVDITVTGATEVGAGGVDTLVLTTIAWLVITEVDGGGVLVAACVLAADPEVPAATGPSAR